MATPEDAHEALEPPNDEAAEAARIFEAYTQAVADGDNEAQQAAMGQLMLHAMQMKHEITPRLQALSEASEREVALDWTGAEAAYKRAISITDDVMQQARDYDSLSRLYFLVDRPEMQLEALQKATRLDRSEESYAPLAFRLHREAQCYLNLGQPERALPLIEEAFASAQETSNDFIQALLITQRAQYRVQIGDLADAENDLATTWELLNPGDENYLAAGLQSTLGAWWQITAKLRTRQNDHRAAIAAWKEALYRVDIVNGLPHIEQGPYGINARARLLRDLGKSLRVAGEEAEATAAFEESRSLRRSIGMAPLEE
ncbi:hypothetical protein EON80_25925 [bacterium]|nr:MAG: hypothetical protein EON80_25925 [bacterium]